jgi:uncharacterized protein YqiB (DUF1249 family)
VRLESEALIERIEKLAKNYIHLLCLVDRMDEANRSRNYVLVIAQNYKLKIVEYIDFVRSPILVELELNTFVIRKAWKDNTENCPGHIA